MTQLKRLKDRKTQAQIDKRAVKIQARRTAQERLVMQQQMFMTAVAQYLYERTLRRRIARLYWRAMRLLGVTKKVAA